MPKCTRKGCGKEYKDEDNTDGACLHHVGSPVFHEGLKSWSCCKDINKPVLDFESFMKLPGCTSGIHTSEKPVESALQTAETPSGLASATPPNDTSARQAPVAVSKSASGTETYTTSTPSTTIAAANPSAPPPAPVIIEDEDDVDVPVEPGTRCKRTGCGKSFVNQEESRLGSGEESICVYHPSPPIFREGSKVRVEIGRRLHGTHLIAFKGYMCCKKRVLDFDDFMKIQGCKTGKHVFVKKPRADAVPGDDFVKCRIDHYQTPSEVHVTVYAKKADKEKSSVKFESEQVHIDLTLPDSKRFVKTVSLYGPIDPEASSFTFFGTKVLDLLLVKQDNRSWNVLEKVAEEALPQGYNITFGVGGRTGSVGGKHIILDEGNKSKST